MAKLPDPPSLQALRKLSPPMATLAKGDALARIYMAGGDHPAAWNDFRAWGPVTHARFDHHLLDDAGRPHHQSRSVLYCAPDAKTCLAEVFQHARVIDRTRRDPCLAIFELRRSVQLIDLTGDFVTRMGASLAIHSGPRNRARRWAIALYEAYGHEGLLYRSSMNAGEPAVVFSEHARDALPSSPEFNRPLSDPSLTDTIDACAYRLGYLKG